MRESKVWRKWVKVREEKRPAEARKTAGDPNSAISWAELAKVLGEPPLGRAGTSRRPAGNVYGESNPNSRARAEEDRLKFVEVMGRKPTAKEMQMIEQRWLGWGYDS